MVANSFGIPRGMLYNDGMPIEPQQERLYTITEAAGVLGKTRQRIHQLIGDGRIEAEQHGGIWFIRESNLKIKPSTKVAGRPPKKTP